MKDLRQTRKADWYFIVLATLIWVAALGVTAWDFVQNHHPPLPPEIFAALGLGVMLVGIVIRRVARRTLGEHFSYALKTTEKHRLVKHGIYGYVRHPAYSGDLLFQFGIPLLFASAYGFLVMLLLVPCILYRVKIEEQMLVEKFGDEYIQYAQNTKRLIPYVY